MTRRLQFIILGVHIAALFLVGGMILWRERPRRHHAEVNWHFVTGIPDKVKDRVCPPGSVHFVDTTVDGEPCLVEGVRSFPQDPDEPLQAVYDAAAWVHGQGGGHIEVDPQTLGRGRYLDYLGPDLARSRPHWWSFAWLFSTRTLGGDCFCRMGEPARVYITVRKAKR